VFTCAGGAWRGGYFWQHILDSYLIFICRVGALLVSRQQWQCVLSCKQGTAWKQKENKGSQDIVLYLKME